MIPKRRDERYLIAAELRDAKNAEVARIVGGDEVQLVLADDLISRIVVQSSPPGRACRPSIPNCSISTAAKSTRPSSRS